MRCQSPPPRAQREVPTWTRPHRPRRHPDLGLPLQSCERLVSVTGKPVRTDTAAKWTPTDMPEADSAWGLWLETPCYHTCCQSEGQGKEEMLSPVATPEGQRGHWSPGASCLGADGCESHLGS